MSTRPRAVVLAGLFVVLAGILGLVLDGPGTTSGATGTDAPSVTTGPMALGAPDRLPRSEEGGLGEADGVVPDGVTVFDDGHPAVGRLDPALLAALRHAATDAARAGVTLYVDSGWRSARYQDQLLRQAIGRYGSAKEAARWVATPETSAHVSGDAVDIGHAVAARWLAKHGAASGLCQTYRNEPWHFELRPRAVEHGCPPMYADPTRDPRMQP
jgi:hypothetical protein